MILGLLLTSFRCVASFALTGGLVVRKGNKIRFLYLDEIFLRYTFHDKK